MHYPGKATENICVIFLIALLICTTFWTVLGPGNNYAVYVNEQTVPLNVVSKRFLSIGLDTLEISNGVNNLHLNSTKLIEMTSLLGSGYLRLGGTMSDRLIFSNRSFNSTNGNHPKKCENISCFGKFLPFFTMDSTDWLQVNQFCNKTKFRLLFDVNALLRKGQDWDSSNAIELLEFSKLHNLDMDFQLGNEPNSFQHVFNITVTPHQLSKDFSVLRKLLKQYYPKSFLVGPDTTRPQPKRPSCVKYMTEFLSEASDHIDAIAWHQYYLNGHTASLEDFWNPEVLNLLQTQIDTMLENISPYKGNKPMWLTETSSAFGGGAPELSNSFSSSPLWLDKLGVAALNGIQVVVRQSLLGGNYSLIDHNLNPLPDWWVSFLYNSLVGDRVLSCIKTTSKYQRLYCHCASENLRQRKSIVIYGVNLKDLEVEVILAGSALGSLMEVDEFVLTAPNRNRKSKNVLLNNVLLSYDDFPKMEPKRLGKVGSIMMQPYSLGFWVIHNVNIPFCRS